MAGDIPRIRERGAATHGRKAGQVHIRAEGRRRRRRRRHDEDRGDGGVRHNVDVAAQEVVRAIPPGRRGGPAPEAKGPADCYLMVDGDDTYPTESARALCKPILAGEADMIVGDRHSNGTYAEEISEPSWL